MSTLRTPKQNNGLHLYLKMLSDILNEAGLDQRVVLKPDVAIEWDAKAVKEKLWKPIQKGVCHTDSTKELLTTDIDKVQKVLERHLGEKFGTEHIPFPSMDDVLIRLDYEKRKNR